MKYENLMEWNKSKEAAEYVGKDIRFVQNAKVQRAIDKGYKTLGITIGIDLVLVEKVGKKEVKKVDKKADKKLWRKK